MSLVRLPAAGKENWCFGKGRTLPRGALPALWVQPVTRWKASQRQKVGTSFVVVWEGSKGSGS